MDVAYLTFSQMLIRFLAIYIYRQIAAGVIILAYITSLGKNNINMIGRAKPIIYLYNGITWPTTRHYGNRPTAIYLLLPLPSPFFSLIYLSISYLTISYLPSSPLFSSSVDLPKNKLREESRMMKFRKNTFPGYICRDKELGLLSFLDILKTN
jgi:hypothetical protein